MAHDVFICYSTEDKTTADAVCATLEGNGIRCWIAPRDGDESTGEFYGRGIVEAISSSRVLVLVFSSNSNKSPHVMREVERAVSYEIPIIPFRLERILPSADMEYLLSAPHWLDALTPPLERHLARLTKRVTRLLSGKGGRFRIRPKIYLQGWTWRQIAFGVALAAALLSSFLFFDPLKLRVANKKVETASYEERYNNGVGMLDSPEEQTRLGGIRLLEEVAASGEEYWYWQAMNQLTSYVRTNARREEGADQPPTEMPQDILAIMKVIGARPPVYPANFNKENRKRDLRRTNLRGLRLVGGANLQYVDFEGAQLEDATLSGADLESSILKDAQLARAALNLVNLRGADLNGADINNADLTGANNLNWFDVILARNWECARLSPDLVNQISAEADVKIDTGKCK